MTVSGSDVLANDARDIAGNTAGTVEELATATMEIVLCELTIHLGREDHGLQSAKEDPRRCSSG